PLLAHPRSSRVASRSADRVIAHGSHLLTSAFDSDFGVAVGSNPSPSRVLSRGLARFQPNGTYAAVSLIVVARSEARRRIAPLTGFTRIFLPAKLGICTTQTVFKDARPQQLTHNGSLCAASREALPSSSPD